MIIRLLDSDSDNEFGCIELADKDYTAAFRKDLSKAIDKWIYADLDVYEYPQAGSYEWCFERVIEEISQNHKINPVVVDDWLL